MPDWDSPQVIGKAAGAFLVFTLHSGSTCLLFSRVVVFAQMMFTFLGVYLWELFTTCAFEWSLITGRRKFTWPLSESKGTSSSLCRLTNRC